MQRKFYLHLYGPLFNLLLLPTFLSKCNQIAQLLPTFELSFKRNTVPELNENELSSISEELISNKIYLIGGEKVMLDRDIAELYGVKAIRLREQVKRNIDIFPKHFMFQLTKEEVGIMVSHFPIPSKQHLGGNLPYVFTEHGVLQAANV